MESASSRTPERKVFFSVLHPEPLAARRPRAGQEPASWVLGGRAESRTFGQHWRVQLRLGPGREAQRGPGRAEGFHGAGDEKLKLGRAQGRLRRVSCFINSSLTEADD